MATLQECKTSSCEACLERQAHAGPVHRGQVPGWHQDESADSYKITSRRPGAFSEEYKRLDEDLAAYCRVDVRVLVLDDTNHDGAAGRRFELADQYQYQVVLVEPKTAWRLDCAQLKEEEPVAAVSRRSEEAEAWAGEGLPACSTSGWFLTKKSSEALRKTGQTFLEELGNHKAFKKELRTL